MQHGFSLFFFAGTYLQSDGTDVDLVDISVVTTSAQSCSFFLSRLLFLRENTTVTHTNISQRVNRPALLIENDALDRNLRLADRVMHLHCRLNQRDHARRHLHLSNDALRLRSRRRGLPQSMALRRGVFAQAAEQRVVRGDGRCRSAGAAT